MQTDRKIITSIIILTITILALIFCFKRNYFSKRFAGVQTQKVEIKTSNNMVLIFFSLGCKVCYDDILRANKLFDKYKKNLSIIGISKDDYKDLSTFQKNHAIKFPLYSNKSGKIFKKFNVREVPHIVMVKDQKVVFEYDIYKKIAKKEGDLSKLLEAFFK